MEITIKKVLYQAADMLGLKGVLELPEFSGGEEDEYAREDANTLLRCLNISLKEIASEYVPLIQEEEVNSVNGTVFYSSLKKTAYEVLEVRSEGQRVDFEVFPEKFNTEKGRLTVKYSYLPGDAGVNESVMCGERVTERLVALGTAAEFCLISGRISEAEMFNARFENAIKSAMSRNKPLRLPLRRWQ